MITQYPEPGSAVLMFCGDCITFTLSVPKDVKGEAWIRTNLGKAAILKKEIIERIDHGEIPLNEAWHDMKMQKKDTTSWYITLPLHEIGHFEAKCFFMDELSSGPVWPMGENSVINVEPAGSCSSNIIYNAFVRQFGMTKWAGDVHATDKDRASGEEVEDDAAVIERLDRKGYSVIPSSGKFRDLIKHVDFIFSELGCRALHLLPVHPTPTTYARMGRYGSPYAALNFTDVDPALVEFDPAATPMEQFMELADAVHSHCGYLILDIAINHTGWASSIHESHPEWLCRTEDGEIEMPGAWGVTWADLTKLDYSHTALWQYMAEIFLLWCRRRVDGFRCDAGYMIPVPAWEYIVARVRREYPDTIFFLEGLGGSIQATCDILNTANLNWAYSELFQNYDREQIERYLPQSLEISQKYGLMVHFAETHDNPRLASVSETYAMMRTAVSALFSVCGSFGFAAGLEWFATEKINVHESPSLNWGAEKNQIELIKKLNRILKNHPCFTSTTELRFIHRGKENTMALLRHNVSLKKRLLILVNLDCSHPGKVTWSPSDAGISGLFRYDLLSGRQVDVIDEDKDLRTLTLEPGEVVALAGKMADLVYLDDPVSAPCNMPGAVLEQKLKARALKLYSVFRGYGHIKDFDTKKSVEALFKDPFEFCRTMNIQGNEARLVLWQWEKDARRCVMVPPGFCLMVVADKYFRADIRENPGMKARTMGYEEALPMADGRFFAIFMPLETPPDHHHTYIFRIRVFQNGFTSEKKSTLLYLAKIEGLFLKSAFSRKEITLDPSLKLLGCNKRGGMLRAAANWGTLESRYDGLLAANLNKSYPENRWIFLARFRIWAGFQGYTRELTRDCLETFTFSFDSSGQWLFKVPTCDGRYFKIMLHLNMTACKNHIRLIISRFPLDDGGLFLGQDKKVKIIIRPDIEDRSFHDTVKAWQGPESTWRNAVKPYNDGFLFVPHPERRVLNVWISQGNFVVAPEWNYMVHRSIEAERGLDSESDLFSPGYFSTSLSGGGQVSISACAGANEKETEAALYHSNSREALQQPLQDGWPVQEALIRSLDAFIVERGNDKSVIAGYPWFLDWGRDSLIFCRGLIAAGRFEQARSILKLFGGFEKKGTLPNMICGSDARNRETSDAPLWFFAACRDFVEHQGEEFLDEKTGPRTIREILFSIALSLIEGTETGLGIDSASFLMYSPSHFTWMDTNFPAASPRQGFPVEIQALWYNALTFLDSIDPSNKRMPWKKMSEKLRETVMKRFFIETSGFFSDCLHCDSLENASKAVPDDALRPNQLFLITLGLVNDEHMSTKTLESCMELIVPGGIRSLADRQIVYPLHILHGTTLLKDPFHPYSGHYTGDEDRERKPAYHNGTAWTWVFPVFCEAWAKVFGEPGKKTALSWLGSSLTLMEQGCAGHIPEILDGDAPHTPRGCDAQAWGASELVRVMTSILLQKGAM